jgi:hypothetical protein
MHSVAWLFAMCGETSADSAFAFADAAEARAAGQPIAVRSTMDGSDTDDDRVVATATLRFPGGGKPVVKTIRSITKGKVAMSPEERDQQAAKDPLAEMRMLSPFLRSERSELRFEVVSTTATETTIHFAPKGEPAIHLNEGTAVINAATGAPIRITLSPTDKPMFLSSVTTELVFDPAEQWPTPTTMTTEVEGGFLFIKKKIRSRSTYTHAQTTSGELP